MTDLGRDLVALEESLKLSLTKALEEVLAPLEERIAALETRLDQLLAEASAAGQRVEKDRRRRRDVE
jgi:hypothetical protein